MIIPTHFGMAGPLWRARALVQFRTLGWLGSFDLTAVDLGLTLAALVARLLVQASGILVRHVMTRAWRGARAAQDITAAATMVAAAWR